MIDTKKGISVARRGRPREFDETATLDVAMRLFWEHGYEATSIQALTAAMGITAPQLYAAFGNKEQLFKASVDRYVATAGSFGWAALENGRTARDSIELLLMGAADVFTRDDLPTGCMVVLAALNASPASAAAEDTLRRRRIASESAITERIDQGIKDGEFTSGVSAPDLAKFYAGVFQGMSIQARDGAGRDSLESMVRLALSAWPE